VPNTKAANGATSSSNVPQCSKIPASEINSALGTNVTNAGEASGGASGGVETCTYPGGAGVTLYYNVDATVQTFQEAQSSLNGVSPVSGLGEAAYSMQSSSADPNQYEVAAIFGSLEISITADASVAQIVPLLKAISSQV